ncbi:MAG: tRNA dihydrouridine synthase DusB [Candidatus Kapaibacterium sp.]
MATLTIGNVSVENGILLAPLEDVTELPFRVMCKRLGADIVYTEFISSDGLVHDARRSLEKLRLADEEHPVAIQIFGGDLDVMREAALMAEAAGPDFIDINCGCWVKNVVARNSGAALLKDPPMMAKMTKTLVDTVKLPVTVKTRLGWDKNNIVIVEVAKMLEQAGAAALTVHCRTRDMGHAGEADWTWIEKIKREVSIPVILNGDVTTVEDVARAFNDTGCDAVMIGRGAIGNPFIFRRAKMFLATGVVPPEPSANERIQVCLEHLKLTIAHKPERRAILEFRKFYGGYLRGLYTSAPVKQDIQQLLSYAEIEERLHRYIEFLAERAVEQTHEIEQI